VSNSNVVPFPSQNPSLPSSLVPVERSAAFPSIELVPLDGDAIEAIRTTESGWMVLRPVCARLGLDSELQRKRLENAAWAVTSKVEATGADGKRYPMVCLRADKVALWLATIDASRIKDEAARARIEKFQRGAAAALDAWARGAAITDPSSNSFGRLAEWERVRANVETAGRVLNIVTSDLARHGSELANLREAYDLLDARLNKGMPTPEQREAQFKAVWAACECRVSERERLILDHVAKEGPGTSTIRMAAAAGCHQSHAFRIVGHLMERALLDVEQRDPSNRMMRNYYVLPQGLEGHAPNCKQGAELAEKSLRAMKGAAAEHVVPPVDLPDLAHPAAVFRKVMEDALGPNTDPASRTEPKTERELLVQHISTYGVLHDYGAEDYHRAYNRIYASLAVLGKECRSKRDSKGKKIKPIDVIEARGWAAEAYRIALQLYKLPASSRPSDSMQAVRA